MKKCYSCGSTIGPFYQVQEEVQEQEEVQKQEELPVTSGTFRTLCICCVEPCECGIGQAHMTFAVDPDKQSPLCCMIPSNSSIDDMCHAPVCIRALRSYTLKAFASYGENFIYICGKHADSLREELNQPNKKLKT